MRNQSFRRALISPWLRAAAVLGLLQSPHCAVAADASQSFSGESRLTVKIADDRLSERLLALRGKAFVDIDGVVWDSANSSGSRLRLQRFEVFAPDAIVVMRDDRGESRAAPPAIAHFRGQVDGLPGSVVFVSVRGDGRILGIVHDGGDISVFEHAAGSAASPGAAIARRVRPHTDFPSREFSCGAERTLKPTALSALATAGVAQGATQIPVAAADGTAYTARVAIETDYEFFQLFGSTTTATQYIGDLFAYISTVYANEIQTQLQVGDVYLYGAESDPWTATTTAGALTEVGDYWQANRGSIARAVTQFLSGKNVGGGIAWMDVLCDKDYGYSVTMGLDGNFSAANPQLVWDALGVAHELGHSFGSAHTHDYDDIGGVSSPVDCCGKGSGTCATSFGFLPGLGSLNGGTPGTHTGTIMSYCHTLSPWMSNISFTLGRNFAYGVVADRVPTVMQSRAAAAVCLGAIAGQCGSAAGVLAGAVPTSGLCSAGTPSTVIAGPATYSWACAGPAGTANCQAPRGYTVTATTIGNGGTITPASHLAQYGSTATFTLLPNSGFVGSATGCGGNQSANEFVTAPVTSACTVAATFAAATTVPGAPIMLGATRIAPPAGAVSVGFMPPTSNGGAPISTYTAACISSNGGATASASGATGPLTVSSLAPGKTYSCSVTAANSIGTGPASAASNAFLAAGFPSAPTLLRLVPGAGSLKALFMPSSSDGWAPPLTYALCCGSSCNPAVSGADSPLLLTGLVNGTRYTCELTVSNALGLGASGGSLSQVARPRPGVAPWLLLLMGN